MDAVCCALTALTADTPAAPAALTALAPALLTLPTCSVPASSTFFICLSPSSVTACVTLSCFVDTALTAARLASVIAVSAADVFSATYALNPVTCALILSSDSLAAVLEASADCAYPAALSRLDAASSAASCVSCRI